MAASAWYRSSVLCGAIPLLSGIGIFLLWTATRWMPLAFLGMVNIAAGVLLFVAGLFCLSRYSRAARSEGRLPLKTISLRVIVATGLLFSNLPAACAIVLKAAEIHTQYAVTVANETGTLVDHCFIAGGGARADLNLLRPGEIRTAVIQVRHDGCLILEARQGGQVTQATVEGYVTNGQGGRKRVVLGPGGAVRVSGR